MVTQLNFLRQEQNKHWRHQLQHDRALAVAEIARGTLRVNTEWPGAAEVRSRRGKHLAAPGCRSAASDETGTNTSALVALLDEEPEAEPIAHALASSSERMLSSHPSTIEMRAAQLASGIVAISGAAQLLNSYSLCSDGNNSET
jgi:hypothetical protein